MRTEVPVAEVLANLAGGSHGVGRALRLEWELHPESGALTAWVVGRYVNVAFARRFRGTVTVTPSGGSRICGVLEIPRFSRRFLPRLPRGARR